MELLVFLISLVILLTLGIPVAMVLILCSVILMFFMGFHEILIVGQQMLMGANNSPLMAIPFFILAGEIMSKGGLSVRIVKFAQLSVGKFKGGLGFTAILASVVFAGLSGSAIADAAALGSILIPLMVQNGYRKDRSAALICSSSVIAPVIPPSVPMIVLGSTVGISTGKMFMAGIVPGIILGLSLMITWYFVVKHDGYNDKCEFSKEERRKIIKESIPALMLPIIIIGGIRFGIFTPTEAGSMAVVYAFLVCIIWYKDLKLKDIGGILVKAAKSTAVVMFIVGAASSVGYMITVAQIPNQVIGVFQGLIDRPVILLLSINAFLLFMGMVMDMTPNMLIFAPMLFPLVQAAGIDPIFFGVIMILNLIIGLITPPVGTLLYVTCTFGDTKITHLFKAIIPFLVTEIIILLLFTLVPEIILTPLSWFTGV